ncbi:hypothetical protein BY996DRAFT_2854372 [Phakopsora pachyrhizi]|uniref:C2H2-type domain-containing protein n=1 Tax=Phakopsora pachyrhizi TaxID=170000 RepID=A0AAV0BJQ4_PHAPC|nr:hypothetical protein BY996DRAFT_2854372 [Phakopsora pachyrhizi]CAH7686813.1 hypothetical protein PPACK8108_LOCUS21513 [Phakopsora pachyrhizi]
MPGSSHKVSASLERLLIKNTEAESLMDKGNYRCPNCNRLCKSLASFEKHQSACTHRNGALSLECRFCNRPYTYIGYLDKHEAACAQVAEMCSNSSFNLNQK